MCAKTRPEIAGDVRSGVLAAKSKFSPRLAYTYTHTHIYLYIYTYIDINTPRRRALRLVRRTIILSRAGSDNRPGCLRVKRVYYYVRLARTTPKTTTTPTFCIPRACESPSRISMAHVLRGSTYVFIILVARFFPTAYGTK